MTDNKNMRRLNAVDAPPMFYFKAGEIEWFVPPRIDMCGKPPLQQRKVRPSSARNEAKINVTHAVKKHTRS